MSAKTIARSTVVIAVFSASLNAFSAPKLKFIGDQNISTGEKFKETELGGLSGLAYDKAKNKILAVCDDRSALNDARYYEFDLKLDEKNFKVTPSAVITMKAPDGKPFKKGMVDFEGIALWGEDIILSSEGWINKEPPVQPEIFRFTRSGDYKTSVALPEQFLAKKESVKFGPRDNLVFEALSSSKDGKVLWAGAEEALLQDDRTSTPSYESTLRLIQYKDLKPVKQVAYKLEKVPSIPVAGLTVGETGLSEILAVDENHFYSIERSYMPLAKKAVIRLFYNTVTDKTTDISKMDSLEKSLKDIKRVDKELIANLEDFKTQMNVDFQNLDNIEGITFGPVLPNGHETIILVSDNNFKKNQRTQFLAFEILP